MHLSHNRERFEGLAEVLSRHQQVYVISDEIYEHIVFDDAKHISFAAIANMKERTIVVPIMDFCPIICVHKHVPAEIIMFPDVGDQSRHKNNQYQVNGFSKCYAMTGFRLGT